MPDMTTGVAHPQGDGAQYIAPEAGPEARALAERLGFTPALVEECVQTGW